MIAPPVPKELVHHVRVRYSDCDPQGVAFFANHLEYCDIAMGELWREAIGPYDDMVQAGVDMVVAEAGIRYRSPIPFDAEVEVRAQVRHLGTTSMQTDLTLSIDGALCSEANLRHVFVKTHGSGKTEIPADVRTALEPYLAD